jgi:hypothetical protein
MHICKSSAPLLRAQRPQSPRVEAKVYTGVCPQPDGRGNPQKGPRADRQTPSAREARREQKDTKTPPECENQKAKRNTAKKNPPRHGKPHAIARPPARTLKTCRYLERNHNCDGGEDQRLEFRRILYRRDGVGDKKKKKKKNRRVIAIVPRVAIPCFSQSYSGEEGMERMRDSGLTTLMMD